MSIKRALATGGLCSVLAFGTIATAWADPDGSGGGGPGIPAQETALNGGFIYFLNDNRRSVWVVNSSCDAAGTCTGRVTSARNWSAPIARTPGGKWSIERDSPTDGWVCPDGTIAPAHYSYQLDPANLTGTLTYTKKAGACGNPDTPTDTDAINLALI